MAADYLIRKHSNRKLYNMTTHAYVTLKEIYNFFREGQSVKIVDTSSGKDITDDVILQSLAFSTSAKLKRKLVDYAKQDTV